LKILIDEHSTVNSHEVCDIPAILAQKLDHVRYADLIIDTFDEMLRQSEQQPLVMSIPLHPFIVGQPFRMRQLRRAFEHINAVVNAPDSPVWMAQPGDIVEHVLQLPLGTLPGDPRSQQ
jgi:allantoinase